MRSVRVCVRSEIFSRQIREMQQWLDQIGFSPARFDYDLDDINELISVRVDFPAAEEADIFCTEFGGEVVPR